MVNNSFIFYRSFHESAEDLTDVEYGQLMRAINEYALNETLPELTGVLKGFFKLIKPQLDANKKRRENGSKGGRPKKEEKETNGYTDEKPTVTEKETNGYTDEKPNVNVNDNVNVNVNANDINITADENAAQVPEPAGSFLAKTSEQDLYAQVRTFFEQEQPGRRFKNYGKEGAAIKQLIRESRARDPDNPEIFLFGMIQTFRRLRMKDSFYQRQPFLPSALNSAGIFDRVLTEAQNAWTQKQAVEDLNFEEVVF